MSELVALLPPPLRNYATWDVLAAIEISSSPTLTASYSAQLSAGTAREHGDKSSGPPLGDAGDNGLQCSASSDSVIQTAWQNVLQNYKDLVPQLRKAAARLRWLQEHSKSAHVVAPCAHDGVCPMDTPGQTAWCHFSQRVERRYLHRQYALCLRHDRQRKTQPHE